MRPYRGKRPHGMTAAQLGIAVIATFILFAVIAIHATAVYCGIPANEQISDMFLRPMY